MFHSCLTLCQVSASQPKSEAHHITASEHTTPCRSGHVSACCLTCYNHQQMYKGIIIKALYLIDNNWRVIDAAVHSLLLWLMVSSRDQAVIGECCFSPRRQDGPQVCVSSSQSVIRTGADGSLRWIWRVFGVCLIYIFITSCFCGEFCPNPKHQRDVKVHQAICSLSSIFFVFHLLLLSRLSGCC